METRNQKPQEKIYTLLFPETQIISILTGTKTATGREPNNNNKNITINSKVYLRSSLQRPPAAVLRITNIKKSSIKDLNKQDLKKLNYKTKKEYLKETFNKNLNINSIKNIYEFEVIENNITKYINGY